MKRGSILTAPKKIKWKEIDGAIKKTNNGIDVSKFALSKKPHKLHHPRRNIICKKPCIVVIRSKHLQEVRDKR